MLTRFHVRGFRSLEDLSLDLRPLNVLVGHNDSGKTNVLDALLTMSRLASESVAMTWPGTEAFADDAWEKTTTAIGFGVDSVINSLKFQYEVEICAGTKAPHVGSESLSFPGERLSWPAEKLVAVVSGLVLQKGEHRTQTFLASVPERQTLKSDRDRTIATFSSSVRGYAKHMLRPEAIREPCEPQSLRGINVAESGYGVPAAIDLLFREERKTFARIEKSLRVFASGVNEIIPREDPKQIEGNGSKATAVKKKLAFELSKPNCVVEADHISEGILMVLAWLVIANLKGHRLLVVDEPENGVHPQSLRIVMDLFHKLSDGQIEGVPPCQIVIATHSPFVVDCLRLDGHDELFVLSRDAKGATRAQAVSQRPWIKDLVPPYLLGEAWVNFGDEGLASDEPPREPGA